MIDKIKLKHFIKMKAVISLHFKDIGKNERKKEKIIKVINYYIRFLSQCHLYLYRMKLVKSYQ